MARARMVFPIFCNSFSSTSIKFSFALFTTEDKKTDKNIRSISIIVQ